MSKSPSQTGRKGKKGEAKHGRWAKKPSNRGYPARRRRNKIKRIRASNGAEAAEAYRRATIRADAHRDRPLDPLAPRGRLPEGGNRGAV